MNDWIDAMLTALVGGLVTVLPMHFLTDAPGWAVYMTFALSSAVLLVCIQLAAATAQMKMIAMLLHLRQMRDMSSSISRLIIGIGGS